MLVNCVAYQGGTRLGDISVASISDYVERPDCFVWVALRDPAPEELATMQAEFGLHELAVEDARHGHQRPKIEEYGNSVFVVLHTLEMIDGTLNVGEVHVFAGPNYILSVRHRTQEGFLGVRARCEKEPELLGHGSGFVLYALMDAVVDRYFPIIDALESELEDIEHGIFQAANEQTPIIHRLYALKRKSTILKHAVAPLLDGVAKLHGGRVPHVCVGTQDYFRNVDDHLHRMNMALDSMRDAIGTAIQASISLAAIEEGKVTKKLAGWAAIFAVATAFVGVWGMNFEFMPELKWIYGYPAALAFVAALCLYLFYRFRRSGWL
jgi:magnesium transporter